MEQIEEQVKSAVVQMFVREVSGGAYQLPEEELVFVLENRQERTIWLGPQTIDTAIPLDARS